MSAKDKSALAKAHRVQAPVFAALGDETRLWLVAKLCEESPRSIANLAVGSDLTRQAITKHLQVLERAGLVACEKQGRESLYAFNPEPICSLKDYLEDVSAQWDHALSRLKAFVERDAGA